MTSRELYEAILIELNKENAPNILLEDFNYFANKAINQYINKRYNIYDINQQTTDDLRVLKATAILTPTRVSSYDALSLATNATYEVILPHDYLHMLNCICIYDVNQTYKCYNKGDTWRCAATRLTADAYSQVLDNFWNKPTYKRPYYYIHNVNQNVMVPTNPYTPSGAGTDAESITTVDGKELGFDANGNPIIEGSGTPKTVNIGGTNVSAVEKGAEIRYGNVSQVRLEIRYGTDTDIFKLKNVYIDYIKTP